MARLLPKDEWHGLCLIDNWLLLIIKSMAWFMPDWWMAWYMPDRKNKNELLSW